MPWRNRRRSFFELQSKRVGGRFSLHVSRNGRCGCRMQVHRRNPTGSRQGTCGPRRGVVTRAQKSRQGEAAESHGGRRHGKDGTAKG